MFLLSVMGRVILPAACLLWVAMSRPVQRAQTPPAEPAPAPAPVRVLSDREKLMQVAASQVGIQEATGKNDGDVVKYLKSTGNSKGEPYCASFVYWCGREALGARNPFPTSAWSPAFVAGGTADIASAKAGDTFGIYFSSKGRVAHTGLVRGWQGRYVWTVEGNTSPAAGSGSARDRDGDGVWSKLRDRSTIYRIKRWLP